MDLPDLYEASVVELQAGLDVGKFTSVDLVKAYVARIEEVNLQGPELRAVLEINPSALAQAEILDEERRISGRRSFLHGIPVLLKDNIATASSEGMNTTAGSFALFGSIIKEDASVVKSLRAAGAIILGKANMSEWAHFRGIIASGWSARGGQCLNAYSPGADPCGSSSGSGVAASIGLTAVTLGTETDGSIICPSSLNNIVGIKPTVGLTSRTGVIPICTQQDSIGPMTRSVLDAAIVLSAIAGRDRSDERTLLQPEVVPDYTKALNAEALRGRRIGVPREGFFGRALPGAVKSAFKEALGVLSELGATVVDPADVPSVHDLKFVAGHNEKLVMHTDFKIQVEAWLTGLEGIPSGVKNVADIMRYNEEHAEIELPPEYADQSRLAKSQETQGRDEAYFNAVRQNVEIGATRGIDAVMKEYKVDALVLPAPGITTRLAAICGYPIISVPLGFYPDDTVAKPVGPKTAYPAPGLPFGLCFIGTAWSEFDLLGFAYAYEQKTRTRLKRKAYDAAVPKTQLANVIGNDNIGEFKR